MRWWALAGPALTVAGVLVIPGLALALVARVRALLAVALAPVLGAGIVAMASIVAPRVGLRWSIVAVAVMTLVLVAVVAGLRALLHPAAIPHGRMARPLGRLLTIVLVIAGIGAAGLQTIRLVRALGDPEAIAQSYDTVFHLNAVRFILEGGNASPLAMTMGTPGSSGSFYPTLWHALVAIAVQVSGASLPAATNATALVCSAVVWPLSMLALGRVVFGPRPVALVATVALAFAFAGLPNRLLSFGILYPNLLGYALLPAALALLVLAVEGVRARARLIVVFLGAVGLVGLTCGHPNATIALLVLGVVYLVVTLTRWTVGAARTGLHRRSTAIAWAVLALGLVALAAIQHTVPGLRAMGGRAVYPVQTTMAQAIHDVLDLSTPSLPLVGQPFAAGVSQPVLAALVLVGVVVALRAPTWRWLPFGYGVIAGLWVIDVAWNNPWRAVLTGYWYSDSIRLAALLPVLGVPLAALGVVGLVRLLRPVARRVARGTEPRLSRWARGAVVAPTVAVLVVVLLADVAGGRLPATSQSFDHVRWMFTTQPDDRDGTLLDAQELAFLRRVAQVVPANDEVVGNPWDGSALLWALDGRRVVFPNIGSSMDAPRALIASGLSQAGHDPAVCGAVRELRAYYVLILGDPIWGTTRPDDPALGFTGLYGALQSGAAQVVEQDGDNELLRVTACG